MQTVNIDTHTKGKNSQAFSYRAVGKIEVVESKNRETGEVSKTPTLISDGMVTDMEAATNHFLSLFADKTPEQQTQELIDAVIREANREARRQASPSTEYEKVDELSPIVEVLVAGGFLELEKVGPWRRLVTQSQSNFQGMPGFETRADAARMTKEYRAAISAGTTF